MASSNSSENAMQSQTSYSGEGDTNLWNARAYENPDKQANKFPNSDVLKSGHLFISSKGIGWTSWKKRWFVLTRTSLVFYRADPATLPQRGNETNATLGGIDLNSSGSVVVKADKKLLTVLFPDGRDGRAFTLKAETSEDLYEWKAALENALVQAPSAALSTGQNGVLQNDITEPAEASNDQCVNSESAKSTVIGRPVLLALEESDGSPSFLEKALRFIEDHGLNVEGILRQSADVEEVKQRVREYEQGKVEFSSDEDAHVIGDCIKYVLREMPSSPVPASCCTSLVEAYKSDRARRIDAIRTVIYETFPEPNRLLMQRILKMMQKVESHKSQNRMSLSALAACMAPLLLRPLLAGDCEFEDDFNMGGDGSLQLLKAAAAANHAQLIVIILLEEFDNIFDEDFLHDGSMSSELYSGSEDDDDIEDDESIDNEIPEHDQDEYDSNDEFTDNDIPEDDGSHEEHYTTDDSTDNVIEKNDGYHAQPSDAALHKVDDSKHSCTETKVDKQKTDGASLQESDVTSKSLPNSELQGASQNKSSTSDISFPKESCAQKHEMRHKSLAIASSGGVSEESIDDSPTSITPTSVTHNPSNVGRAAEKSNEPGPRGKRATRWGRTSARKNLSMESMNTNMRDEIAIQKLENNKNDLQNKIAKEVKGNEILKESLEKRKEALYERRLALEREVVRLQEQLQNERDLKASLESGLMKQKVADIQGQINHDKKQGCASVCESCGRHLYSRDHPAEKVVEVVRSTGLVDQQEKFLKQSKKTAANCEIVDSVKTGQTIASKTFPPEIEDEQKGAQMQWPSSIALNILKLQASGSVPSSEELRVTGLSGAADMSSRTEETTSSSSVALTKLTNRLNFLRERRAQIANEIKNVHNNPNDPPHSADSS